MRIAFFTDTFPPEVNGVANTAARAAGALVKSGHTVCVFTVSKLSKKELEAASKGSYEVETVSSLGLPIYLGVRTTMPVGLALRKVARFKPDVIHSHTPFSMGWEAVWAARFLGIPLVGTHHTFFDHYLKHVYLDYEWAEQLSWKLTVGYYNRCDLVVSPTRALVDELLSNGLKRPFEIVPNSVDTDQFHPSDDQAEVKRKLRLPGKVVIHMGRLSYEKSVDEAVRAFARMITEDPTLVLVVAGDGPGKSDLEALVKTLDLEKRVRFTGFVYGKELVELLQASDVFITGSKSENMPLAILEAMACGLPIVAVRSLGLTEMVADQKNGYLLPPDDTVALANHTLKLLREEELNAAFSKESRTLALQYSESSITSRFETLYTKLVAEMK